MDRDNQGIACIENYREEFIDICSQYNVYAVLSGHTHQDNNFDYLGLGYVEDSIGTQYTQTLSTLESFGYRKIILDRSKLPDVLPDSESFDWKNAVKEPVGDYFGGD